MIRKKRDLRRIDPKLIDLLNSRAESYDGMRYVILDSLDEQGRYPVYFYQNHVKTVYEISIHLSGYCNMIGASFSDDIWEELLRVSGGDHINFRVSHDMDLYHETLNKIAEDLAESEPYQLMDLF